MSKELFSRFVLGIAAVFAILIVSCCKNPTSNMNYNVPLKDFFGLQPRARIEWPNMHLTVPTNYPSSEAYISAKARFEGGNIVIQAKYVLKNTPTTTTFNLPKLGMTEEEVSSAKVFWLDPDGAKHIIEVQSKKLEQR